MSGFMHLCSDVGKKKNSWRRIYMKFSFVAYSLHQYRVYSMIPIPLSTLIHYLRQVILKHITVLAIT